MKVLVLSASLSFESKSRLMAKEVFAQLPTELKGASVEKEFLDLRDHKMPLCDGGACYGEPVVQALEKKIAAVDCVIVGFPVYNYSCSAALKNLIELTGSAWENKVVGFVCAAGGKSSYMSVMGIANSLMLDFRSLIVPRFVYAEGGSFDSGKITDEKLKERLAELGRTSLKITAGVRD